MKEVKAKPFQNLTKSWQISKETYYHSRVDKVVRFLEVDDCGDDR
jgi:hypothetical protein